jgi:thiamine pyrophosphokinase
MKTESSKLMLIERDYNLTSRGFINIFPYPEATISLKGFTYPLEHYTFKAYDVLGISNELSQDEGYIQVHSGRILLIETDKVEDNKKSA